MQDREEVGAAAVDYLMYSGYICLAYFWADMARVAHEQLAAGTSETAFYQAKIHCSLLLSTHPASHPKPCPSHASGSRCFDVLNKLILISAINPSLGSILHCRLNPVLKSPMPRPHAHLPNLNPLFVVRKLHQPKHA